MARCLVASYGNLLPHTLLQLYGDPSACKISSLNTNLVRDVAKDAGHDGDDDDDYDFKDFDDDNNKDDGDATEDKDAL